MFSLQAHISMPHLWLEKIPKDSMDIQKRIESPSTPIRKEARSGSGPEALKSNELLPKKANKPCLKRDTPPKTNMEPENGPLEKEIPIGNHHFQVLC